MKTRPGLRAPCKGPVGARRVRARSGPVCYKPGGSVLDGPGRASLSPVGARRIKTRHLPNAYRLRARLGPAGWGLRARWWPPTERSSGIRRMKAGPGARRIRVQLGPAAQKSGRGPLTEAPARARRMKTRPGTVAYEGPAGTHRLGPAGLEGETSALLGPSYVWSLSLLGPRYGYLYFYFFILFYFILLYHF